MTRIKICCISTVEEARLAVHHGASALGFVSEMPSGPGVISEDLIAEIVATVPPPIATFLLTSRCKVEDIVAQQKKCGVNTVQFCERLSGESYAELRRAMPGVGLVQVVQVCGEEAVFEAIRFGPMVDALLLDSGNHDLDVKELGGTGRTHDWGVSAEIVKESTVPVFLAGGLGAGNVGEAIGVVKPFGVDLCSGVRSGGELDEVKLEEFVRAVKACD